MGRVLATFATILILVLGAAFAVPAFTDWNSYRPDIEQAASAILGRNVQIRGGIEIALLPEPHFRAGKVAAENGAGDSAYMTADAVDLTLSLQALLGGRLEASKLKLLRPAVTVDFSKPRPEPGRAEAGMLPMAGGVNSVEIEDGGILVLPKHGGASGALILTKIDGTVSAAPPGDSYRFSGRFSQKDRRFEAKFLAAAAAGKGIKLNGSATDLASKAVFQADGMLSAPGEPVFQGSLTIHAPLEQGRLRETPFDVQLKSAAKIGLSEAALDDLTLTIDPQNRPQVLLGSANIAFGAKTASIALQAQSLDADVLLAGPAEPSAAASTPAPQDWNSLQSAADNLLWLYPNFALRLSFEASQIQLKGEPIENVQIHGTRTAQRWLFEKAQATLPGESSIRLAGSLTRTDGAPQLIATASLDGKRLGRLSRWAAASTPAAQKMPAGAFSVKGSLTLSNEVTEFEAVTGNLDGTAFKASLRLDKAPARKLELSLAGDSFDLSAFVDGQEGAGALWQTGPAQLAAILGDDQQSLDTAGIDVSAGRIKMGAAEAKNVAVRVKFNRDLLTVSKLAAEMSGGLTLHGEGAVPLRGAGQGRFDGKLEARSPQAIVQIAALAGFDAGSLEGRRAEDLAPAVLTVSYGTDPAAGSAAAQLAGTLGTARINGRAQLKGPLSEWRTGSLNAQLGVSALDGNKLLALFFPDAGLAPGASLSPGTLSIRINGASGKFETSGMLNAGVLQMQIAGTAGLEAQSVAFTGKASASSQMPELFLPAPLLALLGGEPKANLHVDTNITAAPGRFDADGLKAETPTNSVTGRLAVDASGNVTRIEADLKADQASLPSLFSYFQVPSDGPALAAPAEFPAQAPVAAPGIWSGRPFSLSALQNTAASVSLGAKSLILSDAIVLSGAQMHAKLDKGHLGIGKLEGKALGGDLDASLDLSAKDNAVRAGLDISLTGADLSLLPSTGLPPIATGKASVSLSASGQGLSPLGIVSVLEGRGLISLSGGRLSKLSPPAVQKSAEELLASQQPLTEEAVTKKIIQAAQSSDFGFRKLKIPLTVHDGVLEIRRASFRGRGAAIRMEAFLDLSKMQADSTWQMDVSSGPRAKWPPVKIMVSGPLRELGARPRTLAAEDFVRAVLVRKMEGDIARLEGLNKPQARLQSWTTTQEPAPSRKRNEPAGEAPAHPGAAGTATPRPLPSTAVISDFEARIRDALRNGQASSGTR